MRRFIYSSKYVWIRLKLVPNVIDGEHGTLKHASKKIEIRSTPECGNFVVAAQPMKAGETIVVEKPIASCLLPKYFGSHCLHCLRRYVECIKKFGFTQN